MPELQEGTTIHHGPRTRREHESRTLVETLDPLTIANRAVRLADRAGRLDSSSVWSLFCLVLIVYIWRRDSWAKKDRDGWQEIRSKEATATLLNANALQKISDAVEKVEIILDERLPRNDRRNNGN